MNCGPEPSPEAEDRAQGLFGERRQEMGEGRRFSIQTARQQKRGVVPLRFWGDP